MREPGSRVASQTYSSDGAHADGVALGHVGVGGLGKLQAWGPAVVDDVVHLLGDLGVGQRGQEREGLEHPAGRRKGRSVRKDTRACACGGG